MAELPAAQVRVEVEQLLDTAIERAKAELEETGGFFPFALAVEADRDEDDDELAVLEAEPDAEEGEDAEIDSQQALEVLVEAIGENRDEFRAVAVAFDSVIDDEWDGVRVLIAHRDGRPVDAALPYRLAGVKRVYAQVEREPGTLDVWPASD